MPEVKCLYNLCADKPIYEISNYTLFGCKINPNIITAINLFLITPLIFYNLIYSGNYITLLVLVLVRIYLDILDGNIARKCKMQSRFGAIFDLSGDTILTLGLGLIIFYHYIFLSIKQMHKEIMLIKQKKKENRTMSTINSIFADNSIIFTFISIFAIKFFIKYLQQ
jgi:hypothetical protein